MSASQRALRAAGVIAAGSLLSLSGASLASATTVGPVTTAKTIHVVKDQGGGAFYNLKTGESYELAATSIAPNLAIYAVQASDGVVLTETGDLLGPVTGDAQDTPADSVVAVAATTGTGTYVDASTGVKYAVTTVGTTLPADNQYALKTATNTIVLLNGKVLVPVTNATGLSR